MRRTTGLQLSGGITGIILALGVGSNGAQAVDEILTVTATRTERPVFTTPSAVSVVRSPEIDRNQPFGFQDIFETVPGVEVQGGARRIAEEPSIRGFADEQIVIRVDGARQNFDLAHRGRFFVDPDLVSRIEVVRGGASALYGSGALGGVISFQTKGAKDFLEPGETFGLRGRTGFQTNGNELFLSTGAFGQWGAVDGFANFVYRKIYDDLKDGSGQAILDSRDRVANGLIKLGIEPADHHRLQIVGEIYDNDGDNPTNANDFSTPTTVVRRSTREQALRLSYDYDDPDNRWFNVKASAFYSDIDVGEDRFFDGRLDESSFSSRGIDIANTATLIAGEAVDVRFTIGFETFRDSQSGTRDGAVRMQFPSASRTFTSAYGQAEIELWDRVSIIPGVRWDRVELNSHDAFEDRNDDEVTPRIAVGVQATDDIYFWGSYAEAFRSPSLTQLYVDGVHFAVPLGTDPMSGIDMIVVNEFVPTPDLRAERADSFEFGGKFRHDGLISDDDGFELSATYFSSNVDDYVEQIVVFISGPPSFAPPFGPLIFPGETTNLNTDARIKGGELEAKYESRRILLALAGHITNGTNKMTGMGLGSIPQDRLTLRLEGKWPEYGLRLGSRVTAAANQNDVPAGSVATSSYETVDLFVQWQPKDGVFRDVSFIVAADNVFDKTYSIHPTVIRQPGRSVRFGISYQAGL